MSEHNPSAWQNGFDAWQNGYDDAMYDGIDTSSEMPCKCDDCLSAYDEGQEAAMKEIFGGPSAQQSVQWIGGILRDLESISTPQPFPASEQDTTPPTNH